MSFLKYILNLKLIELRLKTFYAKEKIKIKIIILKAIIVSTM